MCGFATHASFNAVPCRATPCYVAVHARAAFFPRLGARANLCMQLPRPRPFHAQPAQHLQDRRVAPDPERALALSHLPRRHVLPVHYGHAPVGDSDSDSSDRRESSSSFSRFRFCGAAAMHRCRELQRECRPGLVRLAVMPRAACATSSRHDTRAGSRHQPRWRRRL